MLYAEQNQLCEKLNSVFLLHKISLGANANRKLCSQGKVRETEVPASCRLHATAFSGILLATKMLFFFVKCTVALLNNNNNKNKSLMYL